MVSEYRICPKCKKKYLFNPSTGKGLYCPNCLGVGKPKKSIKDIFSKKN